MNYNSIGTEVKLKKILCSFLCQIFFWCAALYLIADPFSKTVSSGSLSLSAIAIPFVLVFLVSFLPFVKFWGWVKDNEVEYGKGIFSDYFRYVILPFGLGEVTVIVVFIVLKYQNSM